MSPSLFRTEALQARRHSWLGEPVQTLRGQLAGMMPGDASVDDGRSSGWSSQIFSDQPLAMAWTVHASAMPRVLGFEYLRAGMSNGSRDSPQLRLEADPGRTGVLALPATGGRSTRTLSCVN